MLCDSCGQNEAIVHVTRIENNQMTTSHLCQSCAEDQGIQSGPLPASQPLTEFIAQVGRKIGPEDIAVGPCAYCGLRLEDFKRTGRLGCPHCYVTFDSNLRQLLRRLHGQTQHTGKVYLPPDPSHMQQEERLAGLRRKLDRAVESEDFERAAQIRDMIKALEAPR